MTDKQLTPMQEAIDYVENLKTNLRTISNCIYIVCFKLANS